MRARAQKHRDLTPPPVPQRCRSGNVAKCSARRCVNHQFNMSELRLCPTEHDVLATHRKMWLVESKFGLAIRSHGRGLRGHESHWSPKCEIALDKLSVGLPVSSHYP